MTINIEETGTGALPSDLDCSQTAALLLEAVSAYTDAPAPLSVDLLLCDEEEIRSLNSSFRGIDRATDVLSFPNLQFDAPGQWPDTDGEDLYDPETGDLMLGNIALCKQRVTEQAEEYGHSVRREFAFLITHSLLHLCGYDHMEEDERSRMEEAQREILEGVQITRDK